MDKKQKIDMFMMMNAEKFEPYALHEIREKLESVDENKLYILQGTTFYHPTLILVIAFLLGWERFFLNDIGLGILKVLTCYGLGIWWLIDLFTATERARKYNYNKFLELTAY